jgi:integrating conjugative element relaxase (TIGR03760 family)
MDKQLGGSVFHNQRKRALGSKPLKDLTRTMAAAQFLLEHKRQALLQKMRDYSGLLPSRYDSLCGTLLESLVDYCQSLPETTSSYYAHPGGLVDHALNRAEAALGLFQDFLLQAEGEPLSEEQTRWQYALYSAALLQGLGKLYTDYRVDCYDINGHLLTQWNPLLERLRGLAGFYDYEVKKDEDPAFRKRLNLLIAKAMMPASGFSWIASHPEILAIWLALLNEDEASAGAMGAILIRADAIAIQRYLQEHLYKVHEGDRAGRYARVGTFSGKPDTLIEKQSAAGAAFVHWLTKSLEEGLLMINKAPLLMVPGGLLVLPEAFARFMNLSGIKNVQQGFLSLGLHRTSPDGSVFTQFEQAHNQEMHQGIVIANYAAILPKTVQVHQIHTGQVKQMSAVELIYRSQFGGQFTAAQVATPIEPLRMLTASGQWKVQETQASFLHFGIKASV